MAPGNHSPVAEFILLGLSDDPFLQPLLFGLFLALYLVTFLGNLLIIVAILSDTHLHTPMYFFLSQLSLNDICFSSTTVPKMLLNLHTQSRAITYAGCLSQLLFFLIFVGMENLLLSAMAYDRYVAICHPLHYTVIMNPQLCGQLLLGSWTLSVFDALVHVLMVLRLSFCSNVEIPHFFCDLNELFLMACSDTFLNKVILYCAAGLLDFIPLAGMVFSYSKILASVLRISSASGKAKAFSTCGSHLAVVSLYYGTALGIYLSSAATQNPKNSAVASVMYTVVTPMLNPFIYSLRNKDIKLAFVKLLSWKQSLMGAGVMV